jgi:tryptophan-rich sensory protein
MTQTTSKTKHSLARLAVMLVIALAVLGLVLNGISAKVLQRFWQDILERPGWTMQFRFILQPVMAAIAALHDGLKDARTGRSPYFWTLLISRADRGARLYEGVISTSRIILLGLAMDTIYQVIVLKTFYPGEAAVVAIVLAFVPYVVLRGPITRIVRWRRGDATTHAASADESAGE